MIHFVLTEDVCLATPLQRYILPKFTSLAPDQKYMLLVSIRDRWPQLRTNEQLLTALKALAWCPRDDRATLPSAEADAAGDVTPTAVACFADASAGRSLLAFVGRAGGAEARELASVSSLLHPRHRMLRSVLAGMAVAVCGMLCANTGEVVEVTVTHSQ